MGFFSYLGNEIAYQSKKIVSPATWAGTAQAINQRHETIRQEMNALAAQEQELKARREAEAVQKAEAKYKAKLDALEAKLEALTGGSDKASTGTEG